MLMEGDQKYFHFWIHNTFSYFDKEISYSPESDCHPGGYGNLQHFNQVKFIPL